MSQSATDKSTRKLLLIEFLQEECCFNKSKFFPFLKGLAQRCGVETLWLFFVAPLRFAHEYEIRGKCRDFGYVVDLPENDIEFLRKQISSFKPSHIISSEMLLVRGIDFLCESCPDAEILFLKEEREFDLPRFADEKRLSQSGAAGDFAGRGDMETTLYKSGWFLDWLGIIDPEAADSYIIESAKPDYLAVPANESARNAKIFVKIMSGTQCLYRKSLKKNPFFKDVDLSMSTKDFSCSFCNYPSGLMVDSGDADPVRLAETQFRALLEAAGGKGRDSTLYDIYDIRLFLQFERFFGMILSLEYPAGNFYFSPRIDEILGTKRQIDAVLPSLARAGHKVKILGIGLENFSETENLRFNKNVTLEKVDRLLNLLDRWEREYPGVFQVGPVGRNFSFIMFTPWTTIEDVEKNLTHGIERNFPPNGYWIISTLQLEIGSPITALARKEGDILSDDYEDEALRYFTMFLQYDPRFVLPWRFKERKVFDLYRTIARIHASIETREISHARLFSDPQYEKVAKMYRDLPVNLRNLALITAEMISFLKKSEKRHDCESLFRSAVERLSGKQIAVKEVEPEPMIEADMEKENYTSGDKLLFLFNAVRDRFNRKFMDIKIISAREIAGESSFMLEISVGSVFYRLYLLDLNSADKYLFKTSHFAVVHSRETPLTSDKDLKRIKEFLIACNGAISRYAQSKEK